MMPAIVMTDASKSGGVLPVRVINQANGRKYMLATQCSKPAAMKAETGNASATILSVTDRPAYASHTARQTSRIHKTPLKNNVTASGWIFAAAVLKTDRPARPP